MGFYSWKCAISGKSIPAYPAAGYSIEKSAVVMVLPDDKQVKGVYDGYGNIDGQNVYDLIAPYYFDSPQATRDDVFNNTKYITAPDGQQFAIQQFSYGEPLEQFGGRDMNQLRKDGYKIDSDFYLLQDKGIIKIVRQDKYNGEKFADLQPSPDCPNQGYFYDEDEEE